MSVESTGNAGRASLLAWEVSAAKEEPWRRFLQELADRRLEGYAESRRHLGIFAESVWFAPMPSGGGIAIVCLEAEDLVANPLEKNQVGEEELSCRSLLFLGGVGG